MVDISNSSWNETDASNTAANPNGWPSGTYFSAVEPIGRATMGAIKRFWDRVNGVYTTTGSSGSYVLTPSNTSYPTAYTQGETYSFKAHQSSAGNDTFQVNANSLSAINIYKATSSGIVQIGANDIQTGAHIVGQIDTALNGGAGGFIVTGGLATGSGGVTSFTGDGALLSNSGSTGAVTASLANASANKVWSGPTSGSATTPTYRSLVSADFPTSGVSAGSYTSANITVDSTGRLTSAASGSSSLITPYGVGCIVWGQPTNSNTGVTAGSTIAASSLTPNTARSVAQNNSGANWINDNTSISGTWNPLQTATAYGAGYVQVNFQRTV